MIADETYKELRDAYKKIKSGLVELQICLDTIGDKLNELNYSDMYIKRQFTLQEMVRFADKKYGVFKNSSRHIKNVYIRHSFIYLARQHQHTYQSIAKAVKINHPAVIHAYNKVSDYLFVNEPSFIKVFNLIVEDFNKYLEEKGNEYLDTVNDRDKTVSK
jgi:hypothetical protein